jgi:adenosylmethionine-8-amino-7-oxononanoate aminotransferase
MTVAKGLGGGYAPVGAVFVSTPIFEAFANGSGSFQHGHTYIGHALACSAALAVQQTVRQERLLDRVCERGTQLGSALHARFDGHPFVGDIRGRGLFWGVELVADRPAKRSFEPKRRTHVRVKAEAMKRELLVYPMGGTADGRSGDHVLLAPPFVSDAATIDAIVQRLGDAVDAATAGGP